jgi:hypothetical protein
VDIARGRINIQYPATLAIVLPVTNHEQGHCFVCPTDEVDRVSDGPLTTCFIRVQLYVYGRFKHGA